jgi:hypothetical protein
METPMKRFIALSAVVLVVLIALAVYWWGLRDRGPTPQEQYRLMGSDEPVGETGAVLRFELVSPLEAADEAAQENKTLLAYTAEFPKETPSELFARLENVGRAERLRDPKAGCVVVAGRLGGEFTSIDEFEVLGAQREGDTLILDVKFRKVISYDGTPLLAWAYFSLALPRDNVTRTIEIRFKQAVLDGNFPEKDLVPPMLRDIRLSL